MTTRTISPHRAFRNLPLSAKLMVPFAVLLLTVGASGAFVVVRDLSSRAAATLNEDLLRRSLAARSAVHDRELYLLESVNFAANLQGMAEAVRDRNAGGVNRLLESVLALKPDLRLLVVTARDGVALTGLARADDGSVSRSGGGAWGDRPSVARALSAQTPRAYAAFVAAGPTLLSLAAPICSPEPGCSPVGAVLAGIDAGRLAVEGAVREPSRESDRPGVAVYDETGRLVADRGTVTRGRPPAGEEAVRRSATVAGRRVSTLYAPLVMQGERVGTLAVTVGTDHAFGAVRGAAVRLAGLLFAAMAGIVAIGALLSRSILRQVRALLRTSRELGAGALDSRAPVLADDELGELAAAVNQMAGRLQASHETLETRVEERTEEVRRLLRERTELFAGLSHELRTPIAVILNHARMARDSNRRGRDEGWRTVNDSAEQLLAVVNDILELARAESGRIDLHPVELSLAAQMDQLRVAFDGLAASAGLDLRMDTPLGLPVLRADPLRLKQILLNLVDNAVKYTPAGGRVVVTARARDGVIEIAVADDGVGVPPEARERIFEPFYRVPGVQAHGGRPSSGLGLALARKLAEAHGGALTCSSRRKRGSIFTVRLPSTRGASEL